MASLIDRNKIEELHQFDTENGDDLLLELFEMFQLSGPERLNTMKQAAESRSWKELARAAHTLKSSSGNLGAIQVQRLCQNLEDLAPNGNISVLTPLIERLQLQLNVAMKELKTLIGEMHER